MFDDTGSPSAYGLTEAFGETARREGLTLVIGTGSVAAVNVGGLLYELQAALPGPTIVVLTEAARRFVTPAAVRHLGRCPVLTDETVGPGLRPMHVWLTDVARRLLVYPASAGFLGRVAGGLATDLASTTYLCATGLPTLVVPSMHPRMWNGDLVRHNVGRLRAAGAQVLPPRDGAAPPVAEVAAALAALTAVPTQTPPS
ncbi:flavoprotein [Streptomyces sp. NPDC015130]|uniref:flavoprotein n=1 Tax=Streptomyces sp. NPDC015130 TaxID=3364940 RepID=UPI0036F76F05